MSRFPGPGTTVGIYTRHSSTMQNPLSCEDQRHLCAKFAERHSWNVVVVESDQARSGTTLVGRDGYRNILKRAEDGEFQVLLSESQDRLTRSQRDTHELLELAEAWNLTICTVHDGVIDDVRATINGLQAAQDIKKLRERVKRGQAGAVRDGRVLGLAYGYRLTRSVEMPAGGREIDAAQAPRVMRFFEEFAAGVSTRVTCANLNKEGFRTARGGLWRPNVLTGTRQIGSGLLRNPIYKGDVGSGRTQRKKNPRTGQITVIAGPVEDREVRYHPALRIVSDELWDAVQARLDASGEQRLGARKRAVYVFSGLLRCGLCDKPYAMGPGRLYCTGHLTYGVCDNRRGVDREVLEREVLGGLRIQLLHPDLIDICLEEYRNERSIAEAERRAQTEADQATIPQLKQAIKNVTDQLIAGHGAGYAGQILRQQLELLGADLKRAERRAKAQPEATTLDGSATEITDRLTAAFGNLQRELYGDERDAARARELLRSAIDRVVITPIDDGTIDGRGAGPVRVQVEGPLAGLLSMADLQLGRSVLTDLSARFGQNLAIRRFTLWVEIRCEEDDLGIDPAVIMHRLNQATRPVRARTLLNTITTREKAVRGETGYDAKMTRLRTVMKELLTSGMVRRVRLKGTWAWVSTVHPYTNDEWRAIDEHKQHRPEAPAVPMLRIIPPQGHAVIIGCASKGDEAA